MSISQGIALGLDISRGARQEARIEAEHRLNQQERQAQAAHLQKLRPLELESAQLGLEDARSVADYNKEARPIQLQGLRDEQAHQAVMRPLAQQEAKLGLSDLQAESAHRKELRPLETQQARQGIEAGNIDIANAKTRQKWAEQDRVRAERAERHKQVESMFDQEMRRFQNTGKFSERFLRLSADTGLSPFGALDPKYTDAIYQATEYFDPRNEQANPYADGKVFELANLIMEKELNNGGVNPSTGLPIVQKRIVNAYPATDEQGKPKAGQLFLELEVTDEGGNTYRSPLTKNRSSDDDDPLQPVDFGQLVGRVNAQKMFIDAIRSNPQGMAWLQAKAKGSGNQQLKSDEMMWAGRPQKAEQVYKRFKDDPTFGNADEQYVSVGDFEWTAGDPVKIRFLESVAKTNRLVLKEYDRLAKDDPEEAKAYRSENYVDDVERLWDIQNEVRSGKGKGSDPKAAQLVDKLTGEQTEKAAAPVKERGPDWYLKERITTAEHKEMTDEERNRRTAWMVERQQKQASDNDAARTTAQQAFAAGAYKNLTGAERQQWLKDNLRHLTNEQRKAVLGNQ